MANEKFAKGELSKQGKRLPQAQKQNTKSPVSTGWIGMYYLLYSYVYQRDQLADRWLVLLAFVVCGGLAFELLRIVPEIWSFLTGMFSRLTG